MRKKTVLTVLTALLSVIFTGCGEKSSEIYNAGTYFAEAEGYAGPIKVEVIFDEDKITEINVVQHSETITIGDRAVEEIPQEILEAQNTDIDTITGATISSQGIINAVKDCMEQAEIK